MYSTEYELVVHLLEYYFGRQVAKVAGAILLRGQVMLQRLMNQPHLDFKLVKNSIVILMHHGLVDYSLQTIQSGDCPVATVFYSISCEHVLSYPLLPFGCLLAKTELGPNCYDVLKIICMRGTISHRRLCEYAATVLPLGFDEIKDCISRLLKSGFITNCNSYQHRFTAMDVSSRGSDSITDSLASMNSEIFHIMQGEELTGPDGHLLRVNIPYIVDKLLKEEIVSLVCKRVGDMPMVRAIMKALMDNPKGEWPMILEYSVLEKRVLETLQNFYATQSSGDQVKRLLNALNKHPDNLVQHEPCTNSYHLDWFKVKLMLRKKAILGCVRQLCGSKAARIWNLLVSQNDNNTHATFDAHTVSNQALVSMQTARSILYQLTLRGLATHHEADAINASVPAPTTSDRHVLSFSSTVESTYHHIMKTAYKFASNLLERLQHEKVRIFQAYFSPETKAEGDISSNQKRCDITEAHLLHVLKFVVLMQHL